MDSRTQQDKVVSGLEFLRRRVGIIPSSPERRIRLARALVDAGYLGEALSEIRELLLRDPNNLETRQLQEIVYDLLPLEPQEQLRRMQLHHAK